MIQINKMDAKDEILLEVGVKAFLYRDDGKYLLLKRANPYLGQKIRKWDIPGGRIKPGEKLFNALKREIKEETGLCLESVEKILAVQDILRVKGKHTIRVTYLARCREGRIKIDPHEHIEYSWFDIKHLKKLRFDKYLVPVIKSFSD